MWAILRAVARKCFHRGDLGATPRKSPRLANLQIAPPRGAGSLFLFVAFHDEAWEAIYVLATTTKHMNAVVAVQDRAVGARLQTASAAWS